MSKKLTTPQKALVAKLSTGNHVEVLLPEEFSGTPSAWLVPDFGPHTSTERVSIATLEALIAKDYVVERPVEGHPHLVTYHLDPL